MWNNDRSVFLSQLCLVLFAGALLAIVVFAPWVVDWFIRFSRADLDNTRHLFLLTIYTGAIPATVLCFSLFTLLRRIARREMFCQPNVQSLRLMSWSCALGAIVSALSAGYYAPWLIVALAAAFVGLIVRIVKHAFALGVALQTEADLTV